MSTSVEDELQTLYDNLQQIRLVNYVTLSCTAFLVYDILTNLDREIPFIWRYYRNTEEEHLSWRGRARRMLVQTLFIFGRYYAPLYLVGFFTGTVSIVFLALYLTISLFNGMLVNNCQGLSVPFGGEVLYSALVNIILVIRLNAMYQIFHGTTGLRKHQVFLASVVIIQILIEFIVCAILATWMEKRVVEPPAGIPWQGCMLSEDANPALSLPAWDFTISNIKEEIRNVQPITLTLVRDSVLFYFPMFGKPTNVLCASNRELTAYLLNLGILVSTVPLIALYRTTIVTVTAPIIIAIYSFCASRLIIHTRESFTRPSHDAPSREIEPINFASRSLMASHASTHA
ncbi:hypothetical protein F5J12DRAFT_784184 [Pisolithus orientalis]|uniref:uncharacterized protein n=1 Tax=Pisolithus orientalis TaxID=936130 RepID=UPI0022242C54|nr:uncharacterized protein F5J12DRAFT_784184 [Pisolithus orientalis]KAI6001684.1 hypothetical protein F5J12DRAFT_784184 [Pisolithus orientalis]